MPCSRATEGIWQVVILRRTERHAESDSSPVQDDREAGHPVRLTSSLGWVTTW